MRGALKGARVSVVLVLDTSFDHARKAHVRLFVQHALALGTLEGIDDSHVLHGKPIQRAEVLGTVVNIKPGQTKTFGGYGESSRGVCVNAPHLRRTSIRASRSISS